MFLYALKRMAMPLFLSMLMMLIYPELTYAEEDFESGRVAAGQAAEQRAAIAKRKERIKKEKAAEAAKKAAEAQQSQPAEISTPVAEGIQESPAAQ
jgi:hypothetical protein